jgi:hypothetical protein
MSKVSTLSIGEMAKGAVLEQFEVALDEVLKNITDPNTDSAKTREIQLSLKFKAGESREMAAVTCQYKTKLAPVSPIVTVILIDKDNNGTPVCAEVNQQDLFADYGKISGIRSIK